MTTLNRAPSIAENEIILLDEPTRRVAGIDIATGTSRKASVVDAIRTKA